jgi:hypothetical protein
MDRILQAVEQLRTGPRPLIDRGIRQLTTEPWRAELIQDLRDIEDWILPHHFPEDYQFFLENYGGLSLHLDQSYHFQIRGTGPMRNSYYFHLMGTRGDFDEGWCAYGFLEIASLTIYQRAGGGRLLFLLDIAGHIQPESIITINEGALDDPVDHVDQVMREPHAHPASWVKLAPNFTTWLEHAAETYGMFGYI